MNPKHHRRSRRQLARRAGLLTFRSLYLRKHRIGYYEEWSRYRRFDRYGYKHRLFR